MEAALLKYFILIDNHSKKNAKIKHHADKVYLSIKEQEDFSSLIWDLYIESHEQNFYWEHCTTEVYKNTFDLRFKEFHKSKPELTKSNFIANELFNLKKSILGDPEKGEMPYYFYKGWEIGFVHQDTLTNFHWSFIKKRDFLKNGAIMEGEEVHDKQIFSQIDIDLSDMSRSQRIILLNEFGIIDFLRAKHPLISNNKLASIISGITGINQGTVQSYINPIINTTNQDKSPYKSISTVEKVKKKIKKLDL